MGETFFVRSNDDAPEKGPFAEKELARSVEKGLLGAKATARREGSEEWVPLRDVVAAYHARRAEKRASRSSAEMEHAMSAIPRPRSANPILWVGVVVGLFGVGLTVMFASKGDHATWPVGLVLGGAYIAVRGAIRTARGGDDE